MFRPRRRWLVFACIAVSLTVAVSLVLRHHRRFQHLAVHEQGMMYRSAWLEPDAISDVIEEYQIRTVVNLCNPGEMGEKRWVEERAAVTNSGARLVELPMPTTVDLSDPILREHLAILEDPNNYPMLVHCQHGVTRTSKFLSMYDIVFRGMTAEKSLIAQPLFGRPHHNVNIRAFVKQFEKKHRQLYPKISAQRLDILRR